MRATKTRGRPTGTVAVGTATHLTTDDLAARLKVTNAHLRHLRMTSGGPPYVRVGGKPRSPVRYLLSDVEAWEAAGRVQPAKPWKHNTHPGARA